MAPWAHYLTCALVKPSITEDNCASQSRVSEITDRSRSDGLSITPDKASSQ